MSEYDEERQPIVFIPNKGAHDFTDAERYGEIRFLTEGTVRRYAVNNLYRMIAEGMKDAQEQDYILISSLTILNTIVTAILARKFGKVNFLLFRDGEYIDRTINVDSLL
tara:strand:+ start:2008 stop:2334 length:327 start_codon:yes stop_codon:yes gene_type:complete